MDDPINRRHLFDLFDQLAQFPRRGYARGYFQGRIDEFAGQNAIDEQELADTYADWQIGRTA